MRTIGRQLVAFALFCILLTSCAQTGPPLPPSLEIPRPPTDLRATRKGDRVTLNWSQPTLTTDRRSVRYFGATHICRTVDAETKECGTPIAELAPPARAAQPAGTAPAQQYVDTLPAEIQEQHPTGQIVYAIEVPNRDGRSAGLSNHVQVSAAPTLPAPANFSAQTTGAGVVLSWDGAAETAGGSEISHRYRVYRHEQEGGKDVVAGEVPLGVDGPVRFVDQSFEWEKTYIYRADVVTTVNLGMRPCPNATAAGPDCAVVYEVEGEDTPSITVVAHDIFPPAVPSGLQAVYSGEGQKPFIDLIWAPVTDSDLAGYNVYRRDGNETPVKLNTEMVKSPSYRDAVVAAGKTYVYSVSSVDVRGNESAHSEEASEAVP